jgi:hypothetical protein
MWLTGACDEPFTMYGDTAHCFLPAGHDDDCATACRNHISERIVNLTGHED